ncbi:MAG: YceI family protein, partial [Planctomycetes bacterium]|nr:YceI family protein [Planctomycetota bacterium]
MKNTLKVLILLAVIGGLVYAFFPKGEDVAQQLDLARTEQAKQVTTVEPASQDSVIDLSVQNTKIGFACSKTLAGKTLTMRGGWSVAFNSQLTGQMVIGPEKQEILQIALQIDVDSLWSEHDQLTVALLTKGFFNVKKHPQAKFVSTRIKVGTLDNSSQQGATHQIEGNLTLNGIEKSISFPAKIERVDSHLQLYSQFSLNRKDFQVSFTDTVGFGLLTDENISPLVALDITINTTVDGASTIATEESGRSSEPSANEAIGVSKLSATYTETIPATQVSFEMVLVPGDAERGIPPIYIGKHEVSWDEFMPWVVGRDLENPEAMGELRAMKLRPSQPYGSVDRGFGMDRRPALGMSRLSAERY